MKRKVLVFLAILLIVSANIVAFADCGSNAVAESPVSPAGAAAFTHTREELDALKAAQEAAPAASPSGGVFAGYQVTILDRTTPAVTMHGRTDDHSVMCFVSADDTEVGVMLYSDFQAIIKEYQKVVMLEGGGSIGMPPDGRSSWNEWFADEFNGYRGLDAGSREDSVETFTADTTDAYRQEVVRLVNLEREKVGLPNLSIDDGAMEYAQERAEELLARFSHTRPNNKPKPTDELGALTENIARGQATPKSVVNDWMVSDGHRGNIQNKDAFATGVGCYWTGAEYRWVQIFLWE